MQCSFFSLYILNPIFHLLSIPTNYKLHQLYFNFHGCLSPSSSSIAFFIINGSFGCFSLCSVMFLARACICKNQTLYFQCIFLFSFLFLIDSTKKSLVFFNLIPHWWFIPTFWFLLLHSFFLFKNLFWLVMRYYYLFLLY